jgi:predicted metal-dependent hydrolase
MKDSQTIHIKDIGAVILEHSRRARRIVISVRPGIGVRVAVPSRTSFKSAQDFVNVKKTWIIKHLGKIREYEKRKQAFNETFLAIDKKEAQKKITSRLAELAKQHGFHYKKISFRNQRTRWGSCSAKGTISLNIKLAALPPDLTDYVILHELVHTRVHNHSPKFWRELDNYVTNSKARAKKLVEYGAGIL